MGVRDDRKNIDDVPEGLRWERHWTHASNVYQCMKVESGAVTELSALTRTLETAGSKLEAIGLDRLYSSTSMARRMCERGMGEGEQRIE